MRICSILNVVDKYKLCEAKVLRISQNKRVWLSVWQVVGRQRWRLLVRCYTVTSAQTPTAEVSLTTPHSARIKT